MIGGTVKESLPGKELHSTMKTDRSSEIKKKL